MQLSVIFQALLITVLASPVIALLGDSCKKIGDCSTPFERCIRTRSTGICACAIGYTEVDGNQCGVNGGWSDWGTVSCSVTCGTGIGTKYRTCTDPVPSNGGAYCVGDSSQTEVCTLDACHVIAGGWSDWGAVICSVTCGTGIGTETRTCTNPTPSIGGPDCTGDSTRTSVCILSACLTPVNGGWTDWSTFYCAVTCGTGTATRYRSCTNPTPQNGGAYCSGDSTETELCYRAACPGATVNGGWTDWSIFYCAVTCGTGTATRYRSCTNPTPENGGAYCSGDSTETELCYLAACPGSTVNGGWTDWSIFYCAVTCGTGTATRYRSCTNPTPQNGGAYCSGDNMETELCYLAACPGGTVTRYRYCTNPTPQNGGAYCLGDNRDTELCYLAACPGGTVNGGWTDWSIFYCDVTCGTGTATRYRYCTNPTPQNGGAYCLGDNRDTELCYLAACPGGTVNGGWSGWSSSGCSVTCGSGTETQTRTCTNPIPQNGGAYCVGDDSQTVVCTLESCSGGGGAIDCVLSAWSEWIYVDSTICYWYRVRTVNTPPANGGAPCGTTVESITVTCA